MLKQDFHEATIWFRKVLIMEIYHRVQVLTTEKWTIRDTAEYFEVSVGLVSENLKLADALDKDVMLMDCRTRQEALDKIKDK